MRRLLQFAALLPLALLLNKFGFQDFQWREFITRLKGKSESEIKDYAALVMQHLLEPLSDSPTFSDGVPKDQYHVDDVLVRLANLQLIEEKIYRMTGKLKKYGKGQSSPGPAKGLEGEVLNLASDNEINPDWPFEVFAYRGDLALHATKH